MSAVAATAAFPAVAQSPPQQPSGGGSRFTYDDVITRARDLAAAPVDHSVPALPENLARLDFDAWRDIRFRSDRAMLGNTGGPFRLHMFHLGHLFKRPVTINTMRDGIATPVPYSAALFDYGRTKFDKQLPVNLGFSGFRIHYPLNKPGQSDELVSFVGSSYFRFLGRNQQYGLSARGLSVNTGLLNNQEEFPFFREFWFDTPGPNADKITIFALLDSESLAGAYKFDFYPRKDSYVDVTATVCVRAPNVYYPNGVRPIAVMVCCWACMPSDSKSAASTPRLRRQAATPWTFSPTIAGLIMRWRT